MESGGLQPRAEEFSLSSAGKGNAAATAEWLGLAWVGQGECPGQPRPLLALGLKSGTALRQPRSCTNAWVRVWLVSPDSLSSSSLPPPCSLPRAEALAEEFPEVEFEIHLMGDLMKCVEECDVIFAASGSEELLVHKEDLLALPAASDLVSCGYI